MQARRGWKEVFQVMKGKDLHPRLLYPTKLSFRMEGQIKCFSDKVKFKEFIITKSLLYEINRLPGSPGSSESPEEAGPKEEHTKAHHNYIT